MANGKKNFVGTKKSFCLGDLKKRTVGDRINRFFVVTWKRDFSETEEIAFSWGPERAIIRRPKKLLFLCDLKKQFFLNPYNHIIVATCESTFRKHNKSLFRGDLKKRFFGNPKIAFSWRPEKAIFRRRKRIAFLCRPDRAIFRRQKTPLFPSNLKKRFFGNPNNRFFVATWWSDFSETEEIAFLEYLKKRFFGERKNRYFLGT